MAEAAVLADAADTRKPSATEINCRPSPRKVMKSLLSSRPALWFLFTFNLVLGMAAVAIGAGAGLRRVSSKPQS